MKLNSMILGVFLISSSWFSISPVQASFEEDVRAIKWMRGCYQVKFNYSETAEVKTDLRLRNNYQEDVVELVLLDEDLSEESPTQLSLVHILITAKGPFPIMKHWRQTWTWNPDSLFEYQTGYVWKKRPLLPEESGHWVEKVYRIDDGPNRECVGQFQHKADRSTWDCASLSPIFRRDYGRARHFDYNRHEHHYSFSDSQFVLGEKIEKRKGSLQDYQVVATEEGGGTYIDGNDEAIQRLCADGFMWWMNKDREIRQKWHEIYEVWTKIYQNSSEIRLRDRAATTEETMKIWKEVWKGLYGYVSPSRMLPWTDKTIEELIQEDWIYE